MNIWSDALFFCQSGHDGSAHMLEEQRKNVTSTDHDPAGDCNIIPPDSSSFHAPDLNSFLQEYIDLPDISNRTAHLPVPAFLALRTLDQHIPAHLANQCLQLADSLCLQSCDETHWLICNPLDGHCNRYGCSGCA